MKFDLRRYTRGVVEITDDEAMGSMENTCDDEVGGLSRASTRPTLRPDEIIPLVPGLYSVLDVVLRTTCNTVGVW
jgi:hypothetical protein